MSQINVRIEEKTKKAASKVLASMGLDISTGVKMFLTQVAIDNGLPFTPTRNTKAMREKIEKEVADALKRGKIYHPREALKGL